MKHSLRLINSPTKWCGHCSQNVAKELFVRNNRNRDGLADICKACKRARDPRKTGIDNRVKHTSETIAAPEKFCPKCDRTKSKSEFQNSKANADGLVTTCRTCRNAYTRARYATDPDFNAKQKAKSISERESKAAYRKLYPEKQSMASQKSKYGLSDSDYRRLRAAQENGCAICGVKEIPMGRIRWCVDHDHSTGEIRGLLCAHCNTALGHFRDDIKALEAAVEYLKNPPARRVLQTS